MLSGPSGSPTSRSGGREGRRGHPRPRRDEEVAGPGDLSHFRLEFTGRHNVSLSAVGDRDVRGHAVDGGGHREPEMTPLSEVIAELNDRFGLGLGTSDEIMVYQQVVGLVEDTGGGRGEDATINSELRVLTEGTAPDPLSPARELQ